MDMALTTPDPGPTPPWWEARWTKVWVSAEAVKDLGLATPPAGFYDRAKRDNEPVVAWLTHA
jgi:hypothetical protein